MNLIPTLSTHLFAYTRLGPEMIRLARERGFTALEIFAAPQHFQAMDSGFVDSVAAELDRAGIELRAIHTPFYESLEELKADRFFSLGDRSRAIREKAAAKFSVLLEAAAVLGSPDLVVHAGMRSQHETDTALYIEEAARLLEGTPLYEGRLLLENTPRAYASMDELIAVAERLDPDRADLCLDIGHLHIAERQDPGLNLDRADTVLRRVRHFHIHDNGGERDEHLPPGQGAIDWHGFFGAIAPCSLDAGFSLELRDRSRGRLSPRELLDDTLGQVNGPVRKLLLEKGVRL